MNKIISDCAQAVYNELGSGYSESVYHRAMEVELRSRSISYESKAIVPVLYRGFNVGYGEADIIVFGEGGCVVELKATTTDITRPHIAQLQTYLRGRPDIHSGMIINFRQPNATSSAATSEGVDIVLISPIPAVTSELSGSSGSTTITNFEEESNCNNN